MAHSVKVETARLFSQTAHGTYGDIQKSVILPLNSEFASRDVISNDKLVRHIQYLSLIDGLVVTIQSPRVVLVSVQLGAVLVTAVVLAVVSQFCHTKSVGSYKTSINSNEDGSTSVASPDPLCV